MTETQNLLLFRKWDTSKIEIKRSRSEKCHLAKKRDNPNILWPFRTEAI